MAFQPLRYYATNKCTIAGHTVENVEEMGNANEPFGLCQKETEESSQTSKQASWSYIQLCSQGPFLCLEKSILP